jgi:hypothetical protein
MASSAQLTELVPEPQLDIAESFLPKKSPFNFFSIAANGKRSVHCPFAGCKLAANNKGRLACPHEHGFSMDASMLDFMLAHKYFKLQPDLESLKLAFPLCNKCMRVTMGVSTNINYSTYGNVYFSCECKYNDRLLVSIGAEKLSQSTCPEAIRKIAANNFEVERFKTPSLVGNLARNSVPTIKDNSQVVASLEDF